MSKIEIVKGVELPKPASFVRVTKYPFAALEIGEAFFLPDKTTDQFATYASLWSRKLGRKFKTRTVYMRKPNKQSPWEQCDADARGAVQGVGVWRVE